jgi:hypothetical protein
MMAVAVETERDFAFGAPVQLFNLPYFTAPIAGARLTTSRATAAS